MTSPYTALPIPERSPSLGVSNVGKVVEIHDNNEKYRWKSHSNRTDRGIRLETCDMDSVFPKGLGRKASLTAGEPACSPAVRIIDAIKYVNLGLDEALWKEHALKQLGNLAVTCAGRNNVKLEVFNRCITLRICQPPKEIIVAAGLFCRKMDGRFCRKKPDTDVRRAGRIDVAGVFCRTREGRGQSRSLH